MPTTLGPVDISNIALSRIGASAINSLTDLANRSAVACNTNFQLAYLEVTRSANWNCLLTPAILTQIPQTPLPGPVVPTSAPTWEPLTTYQANTYLSYGGYFYSVAYTYTSSNNFLNDLTTGALIQTNLPANGSPYAFCGGGSGYPSGWSFQYALPSDFQLLATLNDHVYWDFWCAGGADYEIMGSSLFCNQSQAVIQYVQNAADTTKFDALFTAALTLKLAAMIATTLRQDGGRMEQALEGEFKLSLRPARTKNAGERQQRRFNPIGSSRFNQARYGGVNG